MRVNGTSIIMKEKEKITGQDELDNVFPDDEEHPVYESLVKKGDTPLLLGKTTNVQNWNSIKDITQSQTDESITTIKTSKEQQQCTLEESIKVNTEITQLQVRLDEHQMHKQDLCDPSNEKEELARTGMAYIIQLIVLIVIECPECK